MITPIISLVIFMIIQNVGFALFIWKIFFPLYRASLFKNDPEMAGYAFDMKKEPSTEECKETAKNEEIRDFNDLLSAGIGTTEDEKRFGKQSDTLQ